MSGSAGHLPHTPAHVRFDRLTVLVLVAAGVAAVGLMSVRLHDATIMGPLNYNEGWNAYHALRYQQTGTPYPPAGGLVMNNYTPLWFPLLALFGSLADNLIMAGRLLASLAFGTMLGLAVAIGYSLRGRAGALAAFVSVAVVFACQANLYIGIADPQFVAQAACASALLLAVRSIDTSDWRYLAAMAVAVLAGFLKHNLAALPFALLVGALFNGRSAFVRVLLVAAGALVAGYLLSAAVGGMGWPRQLLSARVYSVGRIVKQGIPFLLTNSLGFLLAVVGLLTLPKGHIRRVLATYLGAAIPLALFFAGGEGVAVNIFFDTFVVMAVCASLVAGTPTAIGQATNGELVARRMPEWAGAAALAAFFVIIGIPQSIETGVRLRHPDEFRKLASTFQDDVRFLRQQPGNAICYHLDLCYLAGKPMVYDPFNAGQALATGAISAEQVRTILNNADLQVVHASGSKAGSPGIPAPLSADVAAQFELVRENVNGAFYIRRGKTSLP